MNDNIISRDRIFKDFNHRELQCVNRTYVFKKKMAKNPFIIAPISEEAQDIQCPVECLLTKIISFPTAERERQASTYILISLMAIFNGGK